MDEAQLRAALQRLQTHAIAGGGGAFDDASLAGEWALPEGAGRELALFAMLGQCRQFLAAPLQPERLLPQRPFPPPPARVLDDTARVRFRRALPHLSSSQRMAQWLQMLAGRGWMLHPFDWPEVRVPADTLLPALYDGWRDWSERPAADAARLQDEAEDWDAMTPGEQRRLLRRVRLRDPVQGRELFAAHVAQAPAAQRLALLEVLAEGLEVDDLPALEGLDKDRSEKVRQLAQWLRSRLGGRAELSDEDKATLAQWFEVARVGLLRRHTVLRFAPVRNAAQRRARDELLERTNWNDLADLLQQAPEALPGLWEWHAKDTPEPLLRCAAASASAAIVRAWLELALFAQREAHVDAVLPELQARLEASTRTGLALRGLSEPSRLVTFDEVLDLANAPLPALSAEVLFASQPWRVLENSLNALEAASIEAGSAISVELQALACLLPAPVAQAVLARLGADGPRAADSALDALRVNAQCHPSPSI